MADVRVGIQCAAYYSTGTYGTPVWVLIDLIGDLTVGGAWNEGESTARRTAVQTNEPTTLALDSTGQIRRDHTDVPFGAMRDAFIRKTTIDFLILDGRKERNGSEGYRFDAKVFSFGQDQSRGNVLFNDFGIKPVASDNVPMYAKVVAGVLSYEEIGGPVS